MATSFLNLLRMLGGGMGANPLVQQLLPLLQGAATGSGPGGGGDPSTLAKALMGPGSPAGPTVGSPQTPAVPAATPVPAALPGEPGAPDTYAPGTEPLDPVTGQPSGEAALRQSGRWPLSPGGGAGSRSQQLFDAILKDLGDQSPDVPGGSVPGPQKWGHLKTGQPHPAWALMPGWSKGYAQYQRGQREEEELKLRKQALKGQEAARKLQLFEAMSGLEDRETLRDVGSAYEQLARAEDLGLDETSKAELRARVSGGLARSGKLKELMELETLQSDRAAQAAADALYGGMPLDRSPGQAGAGETPPAPPALGQAPAPAAPAAPAPAVGGNVAGLMERLIREEATRQGVDPDLAVAVARQESGLRPNAVGDNGKSIGLFQLQDAAARDAGIDPAQRLDPRVNARGGVAYLKQKLAQSGGNVDQALSRYNRGTPTYTGRGDPNYEANVRRYLPGGGALAGPAPGPRVAGPAAPPPGGVTPAYLADVGRLQTLEQQRAYYEQILLPAFRRTATTQAGKARYDNAQQDYQRISTEINTLRSRIWEQGPEGQQQKIAISAAQGAEAARIAGERTRQTEEAKTTAERGRTLDEVKKEDASLYRDKATGEPVDISLPYGDVLKAAKPGGTVTTFTKKQQDQWEKMEGVLPVVAELRDAVEKVYGPRGIFANLKPEDRAAAAVKGGWARFTQTNPDLAYLGRLIESNVDVVRRALQGQVGTQTEQDAVRGTGAFAKTTGMPDSQEVAYKLMNAFQGMITGQQRALLRNKAFQHPQLTPLEEPQQPPRPAPTVPGLAPETQQLLDKYRKP